MIRHLPKSAIGVPYTLAKLAIYYCTFHLIRSALVSDLREMATRFYKPVTAVHMKKFNLKVDHIQKTVFPKLVSYAHNDTIATCT